MDMSRRFFLGGAISLVAAQSFIPSVNLMGNLPRIYGNGKDSDTDGLGALFRNEPVIFDKEHIAIDNHGGITFHKRTTPTSFLIDRTINIPKALNINVEGANFNGLLLQDDEPFFRCEDLGANKFLNKGYDVTFNVKRSHWTHFVIDPNHKEHSTKVYEQFKYRFIQIGSNFI